MLTGIEQNFKSLIMEQKDIDRIIEMAWEGRSPFDNIKLHFGLDEQNVRDLMLKELKTSSYNRWIKRLEK